MSTPRSRNIHQPLAAPATTSEERNWPTGKRSVWLNSCAKSSPPIASMPASSSKPASMPCPCQPTSSRLPFTTKAELLEDQARYPPYGEILTYPVEQYSRLHQTSGTSGRPLRWLDTPESWSRLLDCWVVMLRIAGVGPADRLFFPFSFGPFLGFWTAFEAASRMGCLCLPGGGMSSTRPPALPARQRGDGRVLHADLCPAPGGSRSDGRDRPDWLAGA